MKHFLLKIFYVVLPLIVVILCSVIVNPYGHPALASISINNDIRNAINYQKDQRLLRAISAIKNQTPIVFVGDSRTDQLFPETMPDTLRNVSNLAIGGGSCNELLALAWHTLEHNKSLSSLFIGLNLNHFSTKSQSNLMEAALASSNSIVDLLTNKHHTKSTFSLLASAITCNTSIQSRSEKLMNDQFNNPEDFWQYQIESSARNMYENMSPNLALFSSLDSIFVFCEQQNIELVLFSPPTHIDLQAQPERWNIGDLKVQFHEDLSTIGCRYINFDKPDTLTSNKSNFSDPFHLARYQSYILDCLLKKEDGRPTIEKRG